MLSQMFTAAAYRNNFKDWKKTLLFNLTLFLTLFLIAIIVTLIFKLTKYLNNIQLTQCYPEAVTSN